MFRGGDLPISVFRGVSTNVETGQIAEIPEGEGRILICPQYHGPYY